jgi:hypothetical protein
VPPSFSAPLQFLLDMITNDDDDGQAAEQLDRWIPKHELKRRFPHEPARQQTTAERRRRAVVAQQNRGHQQMDRVQHRSSMDHRVVGNSVRQPLSNKRSRRECAPSRLVMRKE